MPIVHSAWTCSAATASTASCRWPRQRTSQTTSRSTRRSRCSIRRSSSSIALTAAPFAAAPPVRSPTGDERARSRHVLARAGPPPRRPRAPPSRQLGAAREVLGCRRVRVRRQPGGLRLADRSRAALHRGCCVLIPRRRHEQLHVEPDLDVSRSAWSHRLPGPALLRRLGGGPGGERDSPHGVRCVRPRQGRRPGDRSPARHADQLRRQQALVVPAPLAAVRRAVFLLLLLAAGAAPTASAVTTPTRPTYDAQGRLVQTPFAPVEVRPELTKARATKVFLEHTKVANWVGRYSRSNRTTDAEYDQERQNWEVNVWDRRAGQIATGRVHDKTQVVTEAWTGPQVAWKMARGFPGAFGGRQLESPVIWLGFCAVFL